MGFLPRRGRGPLALLASFGGGGDGVRARDVSSGAASVEALTPPWGRETRREREEKEREEKGKEGKRSYYLTSILAVFSPFFSRSICLPLLQ